MTIASGAAAMSAVVIRNGAKTRGAAPLVSC